MLQPVPSVAEEASRGVPTSPSFVGGLGARCGKTGGTETASIVALRLVLEKPKPDDKTRKNQRGSTSDSEGGHGDRTARAESRRTATRVPH